MDRPERLWQWRVALSLGMLRSRFIDTTSAEEYTELRAVSMLEKIGLERGDMQEMAICQSMGAEFEGNLFAYEVESVRTLDDELSALSGSVIHGHPDKP